MSSNTPSGRPGAVALIGSTGFIGAQLRRQTGFNEYVFHAADIHQIAGQRYALVVCAAPSAWKWRANQNPSRIARTLTRSWFTSHGSDGALPAALDDGRTGRAVAVDETALFRSIPHWRRRTGRAPLRRGRDGAGVFQTNRSCASATRLAKGSKKGFVSKRAASESARPDARTARTGFSSIRCGDCGAISSASCNAGCRWSIFRPSR